jgi:CSLREA domain-containing protein
MRLLKILAFAVLSILAALTPAPPVRADSIITVTTTADTLVDDGQCSLREAVIAANTDASRGGCPAGSGADTIRFAAALVSPVKINLMPGYYTEDESLNGDLDVSSVVTFEGRPEAPVTLDAGGELETSILGVLNTGRVTMSDFVLRGSGDKAGPAVLVSASGALTMTRILLVDHQTAAIDALGRLTLSDSSIASCENGLEVLNGRADLARVDISDTPGGALRVDSGALTVTNANLVGGIELLESEASFVRVELSGSGSVRNHLGKASFSDCVIRGRRGSFGGLRNDGATAQMTIRNCRVTGNTADLRGGGISNGGTLEVENSTIDGNTALKGGGIYHEGVHLKLTNVTISGNTATDNGGGLYAARESILRYVTFAGNSAGGAGNGGNLFVDEAQVAVAGSVFHATAGDDNCALSNGLYTDSGGNLADDASCPFARPTANLQLGPLANSGGFTPTHALLPGSAAIDAGASPYCPATDQRGVARPQGSACDAGAYEFGVTFKPVYLPVILR